MLRGGKFEHVLKARFHDTELSRCKKKREFRHKNSIGCSKKREEKSYQRASFQMWNWVASTHLLM